MQNFDLDAQLSKTDQQIQQLSQKVTSLVMKKKVNKKKRVLEDQVQKQVPQQLSDNDEKSLITESSDEDDMQNQFDKDEKFKTSIKIKIPHKTTRLPRHLDIIFNQFSDSFLDYINNLQFGRSDQPFNRCKIFVKPNFQVEPPINLNYLRTQHTSKEAANYLFRYRQEYKQFYRRCILDTGSYFYIQVSYVKQGVEVLSVRYVLCEEKGLHYFEKHYTCCEIKTGSDFLVNNELIESLMQFLELKYQRPSFFQPSYKQILKKRRLKAPRIPNMPSYVEYDENLTNGSMHYKEWVNTILCPLKIIKPTLNK